MPVIIRSVESVLLLTQSVIVSNGTTLPIYGTVEKANNYFSMDLNGQRWMYTEHLRKVQALMKATKLIDRLNFVGDRTSDDQPLQFPRGTDTLVPVDIEQACYELAQELLKGVDPNTERDHLASTVQAFGGLRSEFDRSIVPLYIAAGIPSATAWNLLLPYLQDNCGIEFRRVS
jgi:hypothetical protein